MFNFQVEEYSAALEKVMIRREDGMKYVPELYAVPADKVLIIECFAVMHCTGNHKLYLVPAFSQSIYQKSYKLC